MKDPAKKQLPVAQVSKVLYSQPAEGSLVSVSRIKKGPMSKTDNHNRANSMYWHKHNQRYSSLVVQGSQPPVVFGQVRAQLQMQEQINNPRQESKNSINLSEDEMELIRQIRALAAENPKLDIKDSLSLLDDQSRQLVIKALQNIENEEDKIIDNSFQLSQSNLSDGSFEIRRPKRISSGANLYRPRSDFFDQGNQLPSL